MALDFYDINDNKRINKLFCLSESDFELLDKALLKLKQVSGLIIDFYGTTKVHKAHIQSILEYTEIAIANLNDFGNDKIKKEALLRIGSHFRAVKDGFLIVGD
jgi:L-asparaginase/Glu-tRNA(Gln) amidotransferase subunit D